MLCHLSLLCNFRLLEPKRVHVECIEFSFPLSYASIMLVINTVLRLLPLLVLALHPVAGARWLLAEAGESCNATAAAWNYDECAQLYFGDVGGEAANYTPVQGLQAGTL